MKPSAARSGTARSRVAGESCGGITKIRSSGPRPASRDVGADLAGQLGAELEAAVLLVLGVFLDEEPLAVGVEFRVDLDHSAADGQDAGDGFEVFNPQLGQFAPAEAGLDVGLRQQFQSAIRNRRVDRVELLRGDDL